MLSANHYRLIFLFAVLMTSIAINEAQRRWGQNGWGGQMDPFDSSIAFDNDDSPAVGPDSSVGWGSDSFGWNNVDNNPFRPGQSPTGNRPNNVDNSPIRPGQNPTGNRPNNVDNSPFRPGQNPTGNRPNRFSTSTSSAATTARTTTAGARRTTTSGSSDASGTSTTTPRPSPEQTQCVSRCPASTEYNPVCGSNRMTYNNPGRLRCAASCGTNVQLSHYGVCRQVGQPQTFPRRDP
ncbi:hypothetical protein LSTR_LSTR002904 [Laodelphax striatellus]|uniref:Kazal-like domain-containing protein n=1 Tax=Laodelphax striatellus TaxID=195883 RepID=A0A482XL82_LAOST|nr:hypothetical protein LSTR_LSTR002904 [Laodelphax striatellus]